MNTNLLKAEIVKKGFTQEQVAKMVGISDTTFYRRMRDGNFGLDTVNDLIRILEIKEPGPIFFDQKVS